MTSSRDGSRAVEVKLLSAAERRGTPVLLSASFPIIQVTLHRWQHQGGRLKETNQRSAFMLVVIINVYLATNLVDYMDGNF